MSDGVKPITAAAVPTVLFYTHHQMRKAKRFDSLGEALRWASEMLTCDDGGVWATLAADGRSLGQEELWRMLDQLPVKPFGVGVVHDGDVWELERCETAEAAEVAALSAGLPTRIIEDCSAI